MAGQSITDRIMAGRNTIIGSEMSKIVCKASTHEVMGPKKKHLDYLNALTHEPNINIPELVDILVERSKQSSWVVVFKALITTHHLMCYGNERFLQHLASRNSLFNLVNFMDKSGVQGYDMSTFIRRYSKYLNEKAVSYRSVAYDFTRAKRGKESGILRTLPAEKLLKTLPVLQNQLDSLLAFDANSNELSNGVINSCFMLLFKDIIRLFASYNDGIINLLEKYFDMKKPQCKESLDIYKKFLTRMSKVSEFLKVAALVGIDKGDIPDLAQAPNSLLDALEQHLNAMDGKKGSLKQSEAAAAQVNSFTAASSSFSQFDDKKTQETLKEEAERLQAFKEEKQRQMQMQNTTIDSSFNAQPKAAAAFSVDFSSTPAPAPVVVSTANANSLFDLESVFTAPQSQPAQTNSFAPMSFNGTTNVQPGFDAFSAPNNFQNNHNLFGQQPFAPAQQQNQATNLFPATNTATPFDSSSTPFQGDLLQPTTLFGAPANMQNNVPASHSSGSLNLDSSLVDLANLDMSSGKANKDFQPKTQKKLTGGMNYQPKLAAGSTMPAINTMSPTHMYRGMGQPMPMNPMMPPAGQMGMVQPNMYNPVVQQSAYNHNMMLQQSQGMMRPQLNPNNPFGAM